MDGMSNKTLADSDLLQEALEAFAAAEEAWRDNFKDGEDDIRFARLEEQWPDDIRMARAKDRRPCLTINRLPTFIRQVVNDARLNKPSIKVQPQDSRADPETADIYSGLIRNIEASSDADVAYDTAIECAAGNGFGFFRVNLRYACDDNWDQDIVIERIGNPFSVYGDPNSTAADSSDWNSCFVTELIPRKAFEQRWPDADPIDWAASSDLPEGWREGDMVRVAEWWTREPVRRKIVLLSNGEVVDLADYEANRGACDAAGLKVVGQPRTVASHKVVQRIMTGVQVLSTTPWAGKFIPIIPVYGDEVNLLGKRHFRSLIRGAKDAQRMFNFWRTASTELVALAPKAPFIGRKGSFESDVAKWETANSESHAFIEYDGANPPQRQPFSGVPAGALQEALNAADDMKAIIGLYDASLGARSNEISGVAINARKREGDVSTFHFIDNLSRGIRHGGRVIIDLIPHVYGVGRVVRILGLDGQPSAVPLGAHAAGPSSGVERIFDLAVGKYDLVVQSGPSFTTRREEAAVQMTELIRAYPAAAPVLGDLLAQNLDWPGADEIARRLKMLLPPQLQAQQAAGTKVSPEGLAAQQQAAALQGQVTALSGQLQAMMADKSAEERKLAIDQFRAETERLKVAHEVQRPAMVK
jgi:hypothetical protein